jgi:integrase/recombinase XerD
MGAIYTEGNGRWWLDVLGKGNKPRRLPVPPDMLDAFQAYREAFELLPPPAAPTARRWCCRAAARTGAHHRRSRGRSDQGIFAEAARAAARAGDQDTAASLRQASALAAPQHADQSRQQRRAAEDPAGHGGAREHRHHGGYLHKTDNERHDEIIRRRTGLPLLMWTTRRNLNSRALV